MNDLFKVLKESDLFGKLPDFELSSLLANLIYHEKKYKQGETLAIQDSPCNSLGIVISGSLNVEKLSPSGKVLTVTTLNAGNVFGEVIIFSNQHLYPATITAIENSKVLWISKPNLISALNKNKTLMTNFLTVLSEKILMLNNKINYLSLDSLRMKIASFLLDKSNEAESTSFDLSISRQEMADKLDIQRPSLSRELSNMKKEELIDFDKSHFTLLNIEKLEELLY